MGSKSVEDLNPRSQAVKSLEMTVLRCLGLIEAFDQLEKGQDWTDVPPTAYRKILGNDHYQQRAVIMEVHKRWKSGTLYSEVLDLFSNLPPAAQQRTEIKDGITRIRRELDRRSKGRADDPSPRRRQRRRSA